MSASKRPQYPQRVAKRPSTEVLLPARSRLLKSFESAQKRSRGVHLGADRFHGRSRLIEGHGDQGGLNAAHAASSDRAKRRLRSEQMRKSAFTIDRRFADETD